MIKLFLRAKHWQLFTLGFAAPFLAISAMMLILFLSTTDGGNPSHFKVIAFFVVYVVSMFASVFTQFGLLYSVTTGLDKLIPQELKLNTRRFKIAFWMPMIYMLLLLASGIFIAAYVSLATTFISPTILILIFPLHFLAMFCLFYCLYIAAKTVKTASNQRKVGFGDFIGEFALLWFFPVGIWLIQPMINELHSGVKTANKGKSTIE